MLLLYTLFLLPQQFVPAELPYGHPRMSIYRVNPTAPHELSNCSKFADFGESNRIRILISGLRINGRFDSSKFANFEQVRELISSLFRKKGPKRVCGTSFRDAWPLQEYFCKEGLEYQTAVCPKKLLLYNYEDFQRAASFSLNKVPRVLPFMENCRIPSTSLPPLNNLSISTSAAGIQSALAYCTTG